MADSAPSSTVAPQHGATVRLSDLAVTAHTLVTAVGVGLEAHRQAFLAERTGLRPQAFETAELGTWLGVVEGLDALPWPTEWAHFDCRNNRLAEMAVRSDGFEQAVSAAVQRWGAHRVAVLMGTSTSGILETEIAYRHRDPSTGALPPRPDYAGTHNTYSVGRYIRERLALKGPAFVVSTACSSSAKVYASAQRMMAAGLIDAAVVGGVDSLCLTTLYGFRSLELVSPDICRPWDARRRGLSLGEAAALALLEREPVPGRHPLGWLSGVGETSDAHHMSSPHPEGAGAVAAMRQALAAAGLVPQDIGYLNLHGTATPGNDAAEDQAVRAVFTTPPPCSSTKGYTGHTLGAAGGVEASFALLALSDGLLPSNLNLLEQDPALSSPVLRQTRRQAVQAVASNSFGFGGSNACLVFTREGRTHPTPVAPTGMSAVKVLGLSAIGPGFGNWPELAALLDGRATRPPGAVTSTAAPARLPPTERRRAGTVVKLAVAAADEACQHAGLDPATLPTVFSSSTGDPANCHQLCEALATADRLVSPTRFTNSVHNAPGGYWHIATGSMQASNSLAAFDASASMGLIEAAVQAQTMNSPVLFVAADAPYPEPLHARRPLPDGMAVAIILAPVGSPSTALAQIALSVHPSAPSACRDPELEMLRTAIPAARMLPLLECIARTDSSVPTNPVAPVLEGPSDAGIRVEVLKP